LNQIWQRAQAPYYSYGNVSNSLTVRIQDGGGRHIEFRKMLIFLEVNSHKVIK